MIQIRMTPEQFDQAKNRVEQESGLQLSGNFGTIEKSGVKASWSYSAGALSIVILSKPIFVSIGYVENQISAWFASQ